MCLLPELGAFIGLIGCQFRLFHEDRQLEPRFRLPLNAVLLNGVPEGGLTAESLFPYVLFDFGCQFWIF